MQRLRTWATVLVVMLLAATPAFSQVIGAGNMDGRLVDATGAILPGVAVTVSNNETGLTRTTMTESSGRFTFLSLPVGPYTLTAERSGFQTLRREGRVMTVTDDATVALLQRALINEGVWSRPDAFILSAAHNEADIGRTLEAYEGSLQQARAEGAL